MAGFAGSKSSLSPLTAFGEILSAEPTLKVDLQFPYNINTDLVTTTVAGTGSVAQLLGNAVVSSGGTAGSSASLSSKRVLKYNPGQGASIRFTSIFTTGIAGTTQISGFGDTMDGLFFGFNGATFSILRRAAGVDNWIAQSAWNKDKFNGSGESTVTLDPTKGNVFQIQYQWLGYGALEFYIENPSTGDFVLVHRISYANANVVPSIQNPSLSLFVFASNGAVASTVAVSVGSMAGLVEGRESDLATIHSTRNSKTLTTEQSIFTIRVDTAFAGVSNRVRITPAILTVASDAPTNFSTFRIVLNATLGGTPSYTAIAANRSVVSVDVAGTTVTGGDEIQAVQVFRGGGQILYLDDLDLSLNPGDILTVSGQQAGAAAVLAASLNWKERF